MTKALVSARRPSGSGDCYSWVWVLPAPDGRFRVAAIEVPKQLVDDDACFCEEDMRTPYLRIVDEVGEVDAAVREAGVDPEQLDAPWNNGFPL
ncbi:hypothetical protein KBX06_11435 [Micromonospora sp. C31]|uniref:hypothetical protein n=1 Tax=Micromonospora sp. C31 TaxID=2824876 RepID=UPI001B38683C|nr:hypothetical protein [Micromonospora sp. C31]MBQ1073765.1 hypothetical protein [Micromonospora sp. C31]